MISCPFIFKIMEKKQEENIFNKTEELCICEKFIAKQAVRHELADPIPLLFKCCENLLDYNNG